MRNSSSMSSTHTWTMPVENCLDMELTGIKTPVGIKI